MVTWVYQEQTEADFLAAEDLSNAAPLPGGGLAIGPSPCILTPGLNDARCQIAHRDDYNFGATQDFTLELWVKLPSAQPNTVFQDNDIIAKWSQGIVPYPYAVRIFNQRHAKAGRLYFARYAAGPAISVEAVRRIDDEQWHHVACVKRGGTLEIWIDGVLDNSGPDLTSGNFANSDPIWLGDRPGAQNPSKAWLSEFRIWARALSGEEIASRRYRHLSGSEPGLVGYWRLNEGTGTSVQDRSGFANHGTLYSVSWDVGAPRIASRVSMPIDLSAAGLAAWSQIAWVADTPPGADVFIETNLSLDGGMTWHGWTICTNGGPIPGITQGTDLTNARLKVWQHLYTTDPSAEPILHSFQIVMSGEPLVVRAPRGRVAPIESVGRIHPVPHAARVFSLP